MAFTLHDMKNQTSNTCAELREEQIIAAAQREQSHATNKFPREVRIIGRVDGHVWTKIANYLSKRD